MCNTLARGAALLIASLTTAAAWAADETPTTQAFRTYLDHCHAAHVCNGAYLAARGGKTIFVGAVGDAGDAARTPLTADSAFDIGSVSKEFTAATVLRLVDDHRLALDDAVASHLPGFPYPDITVRQLLSHSSGIPEVLDHYGMQLDAGRPSEPITTRDAVAVLAEEHKPLRFTPGTRFEYSNTGYIVLSLLVEQMTGQPFAAYLKTTLFDPLGMDHTRLRTPTDDAIPNRAYGFQESPLGDRRAYDQIPDFFVQGAGGVYSTVGDLARWQHALNTGRVISSALYAQATTPATLPNGKVSPEGLGFGLRPDTAGHARIQHGGDWRAFKADLSYLPDEHLTLVQLTNNAQDDSVDDHVAVLAALAMGQPAPSVQPSIAWALPDRLGKGDAASVATWFDRELAAAPRRYVIDDRDLNQLGYDLLRHKRPADAVTVFDLLTRAYPGKANSYDSLADGYEALGKREDAIAAMRKAVSLDPASIRYQRHLATLTDGKD
ncbi:CubicO group peptidase (beta-lactamase class C family) [Hephaestia caeni]|uniref:CubicO group peptidase (Beta-lactamase class C family) n=1 Tax=Hephaestia caeni TaxID=645617 RepID=A0A397P4B4_9SPHN|nr:serine hydrolase [Hephaestia caeni]RIA44406.1 CubicO group peptidase (beta-lactamase class C family) [Hephaestia caeni]